MCVCIRVPMCVCVQKRSCFMLRMKRGVLVFVFQTSVSRAFKVTAFAHVNVCVFKVSVYAVC